MSLKALAGDAVRTTPAIAVSAYLNFISMYGAAIVTTLTIVWIVAQASMRYTEHRKIMRAKENTDGRE